MTREEIKAEISRLIRDRVTPVDREPGEWVERTAEEVLVFLEDIGFDWEASAMERQRLVSFLVVYSNSQISQFWAENREHAIEQAKDAEPNLKILRVRIAGLSGTTI